MDERDEGILRKIARFQSGERGDDRLSSLLRRQKGGVRAGMRLSDGGAIDSPCAQLDSVRSRLRWGLSGPEDLEEKRSMSKANDGDGSRSRGDVEKPFTV